MIEETTEEYLISFNIITNVGTAKSLVMEALYAAREENYELAEEKLDEANKYFVEGHKIHGQLIQKEASGEKVNFSMIFMHAEDQLMSAETIATLVREMIEMYKLIHSK